MHFTLYFALHAAIAHSPTGSTICKADVFFIYTNTNTTNNNHYNHYHHDKTTKLFHYESDSEKRE